MSEHIPQQRLENATKLVEDFRLSQDAEFFHDPANRVDFLESLDADEFFNIVQHVNARVRGYEPRDRATAGESGGYLPLLGTPAAEEKPAALRAGFNAIKSYLHESNDASEEEVRGASMAAEALIVWVHPFNDGNGRTSRFLGKFIEDGTTDMDRLITETADRNTRLRMYGEYLRVDKANIYKDQDLLLDEDEIAEIEKTEMPVADGIALSVKNLLEDKTLQERVEAETKRYHEQMASHRARQHEQAA